jgi:energy-coupling factor transporter ATP-binding protein EcfA2
VHKRYGSKIIYNGLDLLVRRRERCCVLGINGAGKSTLLKLVTGTTEPDAGSVTLGGSVKLGYFAQHAMDLLDGERCLPGVAWSYTQPLAGAEPLADCIAFYAHHLDCTVDGARVVPQSGGFYGGWITPDLAGPFKGEPGSSDW